MSKTSLNKNIELNRKDPLNSRDIQKTTQNIEIYLKDLKDKKEGKTKDKY